MTESRKVTVLNVIDKTTRALLNELDESYQAASAAMKIGDMDVWAEHAGRGAEAYEKLARRLGWRKESLPGWEDMSDLDKGAALLHVAQRDWEGEEYAVQYHPVRYFDHPALLALEASVACDHAETVTGGTKTIRAVLGEDEHERLYALARLHDLGGSS